MDHLFTEQGRPVNLGLLLHLHRLLFSHTETPGGTIKHDDDLVVDRYDDTMRAGRHHPVLLTGLFVLDVLTIRPFADGNGRVVRARPTRSCREYV